MMLIHSLNETTIKYTELLWAKVLRSVHVHDEYVLNGNWTKGLQDSICQNMGSFWSSNRQRTLKDLARHLTSLLFFQVLFHFLKETRSIDKPRSWCNNRRSQDTRLRSDVPWAPIEHLFHPSSAHLTSPRPHPWWWCKIPAMTRAQAQKVCPSTTQRSQPPLTAWTISVMYTIPAYASHNHTEHRLVLYWFSPHATLSSTTGIFLAWRAFCQVTPTTWVARAPVQPKIHT